MVHYQSVAVDTRAKCQSGAATAAFVAVELSVLCYWTIPSKYQSRVLPLWIAALVVLLLWSIFISKTRPWLARLGLGGVLLALVLLLCSDRPKPTNVRKLMLEHSPPGSVLTNRLRR
jgi:hypothetical protein